MRTLGLIIVLCVTAIVILSIWKPAWFRIIFGYVLRDEMPIWLSIIFAVSAAAGTYFIAPLINQDFEFQKNRSTHLMDTVKSLNSDIIELSVSVRRFDEELFYDTPSRSNFKGPLLDKISELQWKLIDVGVIIRRSKADDKCVRDLKTGLDKLRVSVVEARKPEDQENVIERHLAAARTAEDCLKVLYSASQLD